MRPARICERLGCLYHLQLYRSRRQAALLHVLLRAGWVQLQCVVLVNAKLCKRLRKFARTVTSPDQPTRRLVKRQIRHYGYVIGEYLVNLPHSTRGIYRQMKKQHRRHA